MAVSLAQLVRVRRCRPETDYLLAFMTCLSGCNNSRHHTRPPVLFTTFHFIQFAQLEESVDLATEAPEIVEAFMAKEGRRLLFQICYL